ncbi:hypothetical protein ACQ4PT_007468 [Festuca glaucescens]
MAALVVWLAWLAVSLVSAYLLDLLTHSHRGLPPGPRPLPIIGSLHVLGAQPHRSLARLAKTHGPLLSLRLGAVTTVVASSPAVAREILQKHDAAFASRSEPDATGEHARNSVPWLPNAPRWRALRRIMGPRKSSRRTGWTLSRASGARRWRSWWTTSGGLRARARRWTSAAWCSRRGSTSSPASASRATSRTWTTLTSARTSRAFARRSWRWRGRPTCRTSSWRWPRLICRARGGEWGGCSGGCTG